MKLFGMYAFLLASFILFHAASAQESQKKENGDAKDTRFPDQSHDLGKVAYGAYVKHAFRILNTAESPLEITSVSRGAGAPVRASMDKTKLNPKEEGKLLVVVETSRFVGKK